MWMVQKRYAMRSFDYYATVDVSLDRAGRREIHGMRKGEQGGLIIKDILPVTGRCIMGALEKSYCVKIRDINCNCRAPYYRSLCEAPT